MPKYIPMPAYTHKMPVDISFVFEAEKPAGKHGFLQCDGDVFRFEDGTEGRFWGVNFNGGACFPTHDYAEKVARRLAMTGCNIVRFHQLDAEWHTPNIFAFSRGKRVTTTRKLDEDSMERLDYLIYCLKQNGIYVYLDNITYRHFKSGDGVAHTELLPDAAKPYSIFVPKMIELQKEFCTQLWTHHNPYTGLDYKDDPAIVMTETTNENDIFSGAEFKTNPHVPEYEEILRDLFRAWVKKTGADADPETTDLWERNALMADFKLDVTYRYHSEMREHLRAIGVKIPVTGNNRLRSLPFNIVANRDMDFADNHVYFYDWRWGEEEKLCSNDTISATRDVSSVAALKLNNKPFFISEWDMPWPNAFRAEGPIYYAALTALQNWGGMAIHTYAYGTDLQNGSVLGREFSSNALGGVPYREGIFSAWNDPAKFGLFYHSALIVRRGDVSPCEKKIGVTLPDAVKLKKKAWDTGSDIHRLVTLLDVETDGKDCDAIQSVTEAIDWENPDVAISDNGQVWRNIKKKVSGIDTPRTQILYGRLSNGKNGKVAGSEECKLSSMEVSATTDFGVVALSSLTDAPIEQSDNLLLSAIGRVRNTDSAFDGDKMLELGHTPVIAEVIRAKITIKTDRTDLKVWGVNAEGYYVGKQDVTFADGTMSFTIGSKYAACYYLIVAE